jgi:ABC-2 type transport system ATP-binding protein
MDPVVSVQGLSVTYGRRRRGHAVAALRELDLEARAGEIVGVLGPNGSGKTTLLEVLSGSLAPDAGTVRVLGRVPGDRALVTAVGYQPAGPLPFPVLSAPAFLDYFGALLELPHDAVRERTARLLERLDLQRAAKRPIKTFSSGMTRRLAVAAALLAEPRVLLLDEPTAGLDPGGTRAVLDIVRERRSRGDTVIFTTHQLEDVVQVCDRVYLLAEGRRRAAGTLHDLLATGDRRLVVRGLDAEASARVHAAIAAAGAELVRDEPDLRPLLDLFRASETPWRAPPAP